MARRRLILVGTLLLTAALVGIVTFELVAPERVAPPEQIRLGQFIAASPPRPAPAIAFSDLDGKTLNLDDFRGRLVLVNLWATWCQPCRHEMPSLDRLQRELGDRITVLAISEDHGGSKVVQPFVKKLGLPDLSIYLDPQSTVASAFAVRGLPTSILIDGSGRVLGRVEGEAKWGSAAMRDSLKRFVAAQPARGVVNHPPG